MGKSIVFKDADFSAVAVGTTFQEMPLVQGGVYLTPNSVSTGTQSGSSTSNYNKRINFANAFYWESGKKLKIKGLKGLSGSSDSLKIDGGVYSSQQWGHDTVVNTLNGMTTSYYPINAGGTLDEIELTNTWGSYWFVLSFAPQTASDTIAAENYSPIKIRVY